MPGLLQGPDAACPFENRSQRDYHCTLQKRGMMKSVTTVEKKGRRRGLALRFFTLAAAGFVVVSVLAGCSLRQPGETRAEVDRRHSRVLRVNNETMLSDLDRVLGLDEPTRLTDKRIP